MVVPIDPYLQHFDLVELFEEEPNLISAPLLYNADPKEIYAATADRAAAPRADGTLSPLTSKAPGAAHMVVFEAAAWMQALIGHELNLSPDKMYVDVLKMRGIEIAPAEYATIELIFSRSDDAITSNISVSIPLGTRVYSRIDPDLYAITTEDQMITGTNKSVTVVARLSQKGRIQEIERDEFSKFPPLSFIERVTNGDIIYQGRDQERLVDAVLRSREIDRIPFHSSLVTPDNYINWIERHLGAQKVFAARDRQSLRIAIYPLGMAQSVKPEIIKRSLVSDDLIVQDAEIIRIDGEVNIYVSPEISNQQGFDLVAQAIVDNINPPYGAWGERNLEAKLYDLLDKVTGIIRVDSISLKRQSDDKPVKDIVTNPWSLWDVQNTLIVNTRR